MSTVPTSAIKSLEVVRPLGEGGMGRVYLARVRSTGQEVVIKVLHPQLAKDPSARRFFLREIDTLVQFRHPHAVALLDASGQDEEQLYLVMEYVAGVSLAQLVEREGRIRPARAGKILGQICSVLHSAHHMGILHRDLTCANVMVKQPGTLDEVKVMDFGLARPGGDGFYVPLEKLTHEDNLGPGTPDYVSPEQARGETVDARSDIYSLGVVLYKLLTAKLPFEQYDEIRDVLVAHRSLQPPWFAELDVFDVGAEVESVVRSCLAKDPNDRPQTAQDLAECFEQATGVNVLTDDMFPVLAKRSFAGGNDADPPEVLDRFEAWMPEAIAVMKLRGFIEEVGGEVVESVPGFIGVQIVDPRSLPREAPRGLLSYLGFKRKTLSPKYLRLHLHLRKKDEEKRSLVEIKVSLAEEPGEQEENTEMRKGFGKRLCRELRAFLMIS